MPKYNVKVIDASNGFNITKHPKIISKIPRMIINVDGNAFTFLKK